MKIQKLQISKEKIDINLQFYCFLKYTVKLSPTDQQVSKILEEYNLSKDSISLFSQKLEEIFIIKPKRIKPNLKLEMAQDILTRFQNAMDIELFIFSLKLYQIKDLLLQEAKLTESTDIQMLENIDPLSLEYDRISVLKPYKTRVSGALLALVFFDKIEKRETNFMSEDAYAFLQNLSQTAIRFKKKGLEPNQIFMLMFSEVVNQSIISDSGTNYESRISSVLRKGGVLNITKTHDKDDKSTEFDFFFEIEGRTFGVGAKRTLRERYKQFIKTALTSKIDIMIEITLGLDLNEEKAKTITAHGTYLFVADEIYKTREFLQKIDKVFSVKDLNVQTLKRLK
jgi:hypothetical protein